MSKLIGQFWETAWGKWIMGLLSVAIVASAGAGIKGMVSQEAMATILDVHTAELIEIKAELRTLQDAVVASGVSSEFSTDDIKDNKAASVKNAEAIETHKDNRAVHK